MRSALLLLGLAAGLVPATVVAQQRSAAAADPAPVSVILAIDEAGNRQSTWASQTCEDEQADAAAGQSAGPSRGLFCGVEFAEAAAEPAAAPEEPTCAQLEAAARRDHDQAERIRIAANDDGVRYAFFFDCPLAEADEDWGVNSFVTGQAAANARLSGLELAPSGSATITRATPAPRRETAEEFYNRDHSAPSFDEAVAMRRDASRTQESRRTVREAELGNGRIRNETEQSCTETLFERTCTSGGSVTFSSGDDDGEAARALLESLRGDD